MARRATNPVIAVRLLVFWGGIAARRYFARLRKPIDWYPEDVRRAVESAALDARDAVSVLGERDVQAPAGPNRLRLATGYVFFEGTPDWKSAFADDEQHVSLHRWNWLVRALTDEAQKPDFTWGCGLMRSWLAAMTPLPPGLASESYTVGERIANACLFARIVSGDWHALPEDIRQALEAMARYLAEHIEYHGDEATGNHALNNARALYFAGMCLKRREFARIARLVLAERLPVLVAPDGFMREGSSHYHFLFCRWLLEMRLVAEEFADAETLALLNPVLPGLVERCWFFLVHSNDGSMHLPVIGDVSPDCEPGWLLNLPWSAPALACHAPARLPPKPGHAGWGDLWPARSPERHDDGRESVKPRDEARWQSCREGGWHRLDWRGWTAIWHAESAAGTAMASHAHHDLCSLVLYHEGREVLIDPGRHDYERWGELGNYGMHCASHNTVSIDGIAPMLSRRDRLFMQAYRNSSVQVSAESQGERFLVTIAHDGFMRLAGGGVRHRRTFAFSSDRVEIEDSFDGRGRRRLDIFFQWAEPPEVRPARAASPTGGGKSMYRIESDLGGMRDIRIESLCASEHPLAGWRFPAYGAKQPCTNQIIRGTVELPASCRHVISPVPR